MPEIILDIDRMSLNAAQPGDPNNFSNLSPNQDNRSQKSAYQLNQLADTNYMNWPQQSGQNFNNMPHSSTPPPQQQPMLRPNSQMQQHQATPTRTFSTNQFYDNNLLSPQQQRQQFQNQHSMEYNPNNQTNQFSSNQLLMQQQHPSIDPLTGQKMNNEMLGMNQLDAQAMSQLHPQFRNKLQQQQYSFDDQQMSSTYYDNSSINQNRMNLLQQAQRHSFNMDLMNNTNAPTEFTNQQIDQMQQNGQHQMFNNNQQDNVSKRNAMFMRNQPISDASMDELNGQFSGLSPAQQQQILIMRNQQFLNNSNNNNNNNTNINPNEALMTNDMLTQNYRNQATTDVEPNIDLSKIEPTKPPRRKSLPSIVKTNQFKEDEIAHSSAELNPKNQETYIIENGIKKRVIETNNSKMNNRGDDSGFDDAEGVKRRIKIKYESDETPQLPRKMVIESITNVNEPQATTSKRVSMPSITANLNPQLASKGNLYTILNFKLKFLYVFLLLSYETRSSQ